MTEINRERFEAWLFAQPDDREFIYWQGRSNDQPGCLVCNYLREATSWSNKTYGVGSLHQGYHSPEVEDDRYFRFEDWMKALLWSVSVHETLTFGIAKAKYTTLFGSPVPASQEQTQNTKVPETPVLESITQ